MCLKTLRTVVIADEAEVCELKKKKIHNLKVMFFLKC